MRVTLSCSWFALFNEGRYVHPYALDAQTDGGTDVETGG